MIGTALAILSLAGSAAGMAGSAAANKKAERELAMRRRELDLEYKYDYNLDFLNTPQAKSTISLLSQKYIENAKKVAQGSVISGASDEKAVAAAEEMQKPYVGAISQLAGYGQQRQDSIRRNWLYSDQHLADLQYQNQMQKGENWSNLGTNALNAGIGFAMADAGGGFNEWDKNLADRKSLRNLSKQSWTGNFGGTTTLAPSMFHK
jgi:hypothetical protein